jgi:hypothetical protein
MRTFMGSGGELDPEGSGSVFVDGEAEFSAELAYAVAEEPES